MAEDKRLEPPDQPVTKELPAADTMSIQLAELKVLLVSGLGQLDTKMVFGLRDLNTKVDRIELSQELQGDVISKLKAADDILFVWKAEMEQRMKSNSIRAASTSVTDMEQSAQLAMERVAREALAEKVDDLTQSQKVQLAILTRLDKVAKHPTVKLVLLLLGLYLAGLLGSKGINIK